MARRVAQRLSLRCHAVVFVAAGLSFCAQQAGLFLPFIHYVFHEATWLILMNTLRSTTQMV